MEENERIHENPIEQVKNDELYPWFDPDTERWESMIVTMDKELPNQPPENDEGNREYKWKLHYHNEHDICKIGTQVQFRLIEGDGKAVYLLGVHDCGSAVGIDDDSLYTTLSILMKAAAQITKTKVDKIRIYNGSHGRIATVRLSNSRLKNVLF